MKNIEELTKNSSFRITKARNDILNTLMNAYRPMCYDDFDLSMDKATFYRNIAKFEEEGLVWKFESEDKKWYFELIKQPHAHFLCKACKKIECVKQVNIKLSGYLIESVVLKGICNDCSKQK